MILEGSRTAAGAATRMPVNQVLRTADGSSGLVPEVGELSYTVSPDHQHWHYVGFDRYELRRAGTDDAVVRDRKSGFCLGDRYRVDTRPIRSVRRTADLVFTRARVAVFLDGCFWHGCPTHHTVARTNAPRISSVVNV